VQIASIINNFKIWADLVVQDYNIFMKYL